MCHWNPNTYKKGAIPYKSKEGTVKYKQEDLGEWVMCIQTCQWHLQQRKE